MPHVATPLATSSTTAANPIQFTFTSAVPVGHTLIGSINTTEINSQPTITIIDSKSNTYTVDAEATSGSTDVLAVFSARITTALTTSDTLSISYSDITQHNRWAISVEEFDDILTSPVDKTSTNVSSTAGVNMTSNATATTTAANELVFGGFGFTQGTTQTFTPGAGFTASPLQTTSGTTIRSMCNEWKYVSATGAQTATASVNVSTTWAACVVTYKSVVPATGIQELALLGVG